LVAIETGGDLDRHRDPAPISFENPLNLWRLAEMAGKWSVVPRNSQRKARVEQLVGHFIEPMACLAVAEVPAGSEWEYELKFDGYRAIAFKTRNRVHLASRNGKDFSQRFPSLVRAFEPLANETVIDGEVVALDGTGRPSFNLLQNSTSHEYRLVFYLFDLLVPCRQGSPDQSYPDLHGASSILSRKYC
jgi:ATP-dependent DNA ligase